MGFGNLAHQRQAKAVSFHVLLARSPVERSEHLFPIRFRDAIAAVADRQGHRTRRVRNFNFHRRRGMGVGVLQEISNNTNGAKF